MSLELCHQWLLGPYLKDRRAYQARQAVSGIACEVDCHQALRGPYTGTGSLLRQLVPLVYQHHPDLVNTHRVEILALAPELNLLLTTSRQQPTPQEIYKSHTRFSSNDSALRRLLLIYSIVNFLKECTHLEIVKHLTCYFENVQAADEMDQGVLSMLLRRADPTTLTVIIGTTNETLSPPLLTALQTYTQQVRVEPLTEAALRQQFQDWQTPASWQEWLLKHTQGWRGTWEPLQKLAHTLALIQPEGETFEDGMRLLIEHAPGEVQQRLAQTFIESEGTSDTLLEGLAYGLLDPSVRQQWHDERAEALEMQGDFSLKLGAIPYHREHGASPASLGAGAFQIATEYCNDMGYYQAAVELGDRGRALIDRVTQAREYKSLFSEQALPLLSLKRPYEAEQVYQEFRTFTYDPEFHLHAAYGMAMLYARHFPAERRDFTQARAWINGALAISTLLLDPQQRAYRTSFSQNGLALIEFRLGHFQEAIRHETEAIERLDQTPNLGERALYLRRSLLLYNRAQVYIHTRQFEEALADFTAIIGSYPNESDGYLERGNIYRLLGRDEEALADYQRATTHNPPLEAYYNRAGLLSELGRDEEALADYEYVLELDPEHLDALVNRASIFYEQGDYTRSRQDIEHGLQLDKNNSQLLCMLGLLEMAEERPLEAEVALTRAIEYDPSLIAARVNRAILFFERKNVAAAIRDLTQALEREANATAFYNRGIAYQSQENWQQASDDFSHALALDEADALDKEDMLDILNRRGNCYLHLGHTAEAEQDFQAQQALEASADVNVENSRQLSY